MNTAFIATARKLHREVDAILAAPVLQQDTGISAALDAAIVVQFLAGQLVTDAVESARGIGATWQQVGNALGVSRQAAFQRFGKPIDPRTGEAMNTSPLSDAVDLAGSVIDELSRGEWDDVVKRFDHHMTERLTGASLAAAWAQVIGLVGAYERHGEVEAVRAADLTITNTSLAFEAGEFTARISFRDDKTIAGLYILAASAVA
ncbi:MAG: hypothetical protein JWO10_1358 [Microbacteriaceae bacterium]|nr:hypothetical protein [Microbacteriaceae bacterium]